MNGSTELSGSKPFDDPHQLVRANEEMVTGRTTHNEIQRPSLTFEPQPDPEHKVSSFYQDRAGDPPDGATEAGPSTTDNLSKEEQLVEWYRYGESNPGPVAENHVS